MRKSQWILLAILLVAISAPSVHADSLTLDVSGSLSPFGGTSCSVSGCTLGGDIVIDNTTDAIISEDVTISGETPTVGPFTANNGIFIFSGLTQLSIATSPSTTAEAELIFSTPIIGSLVGYDGGPLSTLSSVADAKGMEGWSLTAGALTPVGAPEPSSVALMLLGVGLVFVMRKRIGLGRPQAS